MTTKQSWIHFCCAVAVAFVLAQISSAQVVNCSSDDMRRHYCSADTRGGVQMIKQHSDAECRQGYSWDYDRNGIWVDHGCRADFQLGRSGNQGGGPQGYRIVSCSSDDMHRHYCPAEIFGDVKVSDRHSDAACKEGYSWGHDRGGIWVDHGCRADFMVQQDWGRRRHRDQPDITISCASDDGRRHLCPVDVSDGVEISQQRSGSPCQLGYSWGFNQKGVWVDHGCRADFVVERGDNDHDRDDHGQGPGNRQTITCSSDDMHRHYCSVDTRGGVRMVRQRSDAKCQQGYSWGFDRQGIWVDRGCRADFEVGR